MSLITSPSISTVWPVTPSDTVGVQAGRQFGVICTAAGNVKVKFSKQGDTLVIPVAVGLTRFDWEVSQVFATGTTATATYFNGL